MRNILIALTAFMLLTVAAIVILLARGYQFDFKTARLAPTGILVATSDPDGAQVFINSKFTSATNNTINLSPGKYSVKISKDGFAPWEKTITIKTEEVFKTNAYLFPSLPELRPLTLTGAKNPVLSPDETKIAYFVASASAEKNGLWILDMSRPALPTGIFASADFRQVYQTTPILSLSDSKLIWSFDTKEIIASTSASLYYPLETDRLNTSPTPLTPLQFSSDLAQWKTLENTRSKTQTAKLDPKLFAILASSSAKLNFSPDENKIFYQATTSALLPSILASYLAGTNPTPETKAIQRGNWYVYDLKEDRNYLIENCPAAAGSRSGGDKMINVNCVWFPTSRHLLSFSDKEISVMEFDGTNKAVIYAGPFVPGVVFPWPDSRKMVILTSLNNSANVGENLYTINLR